MLVWHLFRHFIFSQRAGALIKRISWLSLIGITISVTAFLVVLFVMNGMNASIKKRILGLEPHLYVQVSGVGSAAIMESLPVFQRIKENPENRAHVYETQDVIIRVIDQGLGITTEDLPHIFERFYRSSEARQTQSTGTGLGLAITREIVELHKGTINVTSELGQGSVFTVRLPLQI